jgi:two-component system sensor histidine kinase/response
MIRKNSLLLIFLLFSTSLFPASMSELVFTHIGTEKGLSQNTIFDIAQDTKGNMWFATYDGVNRYNGYTCTVFRHDTADSTSIASSITRSILIDSMERIWIGTRNGLSYYDEEKDHFINFECLKDGQRQEFVRVVEVDSARLLLITKSTLFLFDISNSAFKEISLPYLGSSMLLSMLTKQDGTIYIGAREGLFTYSPDEQKIKQVCGPFNKRLVNAVWKSATDCLWVGTEGEGLYKINPLTGEMKNYRHIPGDERSLASDYVRALRLDEQNRLWIGTFEALSVYDGGDDSFTSYKHNPIQPESLSQSSVRCIFRDAQGGMWLGTFWGGVNYYHPLKNRFQNMKHVPFQNSLSNNVVNCIVKDADSNLWIGTDGGGLNFYNTMTRKFTSYSLKGEKRSRKVSANNIKAIYVDEKNDLVFVGAHAGGLAVFHRKSGEVEYYNSGLSDENVYAIIPDGENALWIGTLNTLARFRIKERKSVVISKQKDGTSFRCKRIKILFRDSKQRIWMGGENGLQVYQQIGEELQLQHVIPKDSPLNDSYINCVYEAHDGIFWIGSREGLYKYDDTNNVVYCYTRHNGLSNDVICGIMEDTFGHLWISSNGGLSCFDTTTETFRNYTEVDGLQNNQFNMLSCCRISDGQMFFGGTKGITTFIPEKLKDNPYTPPVLITDFQLFGSSVRPGDKTGILQKNISKTDKITLTSAQSSFSIDFVVSNYISGEHNMFAYQLEGYDKKWYTSSDRRTVSYTNLPDGTYHFLVKAANNDGKWNEQPTRLEIVVLPVWYKTWWAILLFFILALGAVVFIFRYFWQRKTMQAQIEQERKDKERQEELNQMKIHFFINMSHELRTPLTLILAPLHEVLARTDDQWIRAQLKYAQRSGKKMLHLVNQLMNYRQAELGVFRLKVQRGNACKLISDIFMSFERLARSRKIDYNLYIEINEGEQVFDARYLELIINNLLSNAFKYSGDGEAITVKIRKQDNYLIIEVIDTGIGIDQEKQEKIFERFYQVHNGGNGSGIGLSLVKKLIELHHGNISLKSKIGEGSVFTVYIPQDVALYKKDEWMGNEAKQVTTENADPLLEGIEQKVENESEKETVVTIERVEKCKEKVLIVEDDEEIRCYLKEGLKDLFEVCEAGNGEEAWKLLDEEEVDIVVTDVMMPVMDGVKLTKLIKRNIRTCHIFVLMLTARIETEHQLEGLQVGADDYIAKPFRMDILILKIRNFIRVRYRILDHYAKSLEVDPKKMTFNALDEAFLKRAMDIVEANMSNPEFLTEDFTSEMGMGRTALHLKMKAITGESTTDFVRKIRFNRACTLLKEGRYTVAEISVMVGFSSPSYFTTSFKKYVGCSPGEYSKGKW